MAEVCVKDLSRKSTSQIFVFNVKSCLDQNFVVNHNAIQEGDIVVIYCDPENMVFVAVKRGITVNMKHGALRHEFLIGKRQVSFFQIHIFRYGSKISATAGSVYALRPFPALWTKVLKRHTQILYSPEVSMILNLLDIAPGSTVCESGTGSGSLTHALAVAVGAEGRVFTHDIEEPQVQKMTREARQHGLEGRVFPSLRDVVSDGFSVQGEASAVFLDLPCPWAAVGHALAALDRTKACRLVSFSPCIEQTQELSAALVEHGFVGVKTVELINTQFKVGSEVSSCLVPGGLGDVAQCGRPGAEHGREEGHSKERSERGAAVRRRAHAAGGQAAPLSGRVARQAAHPRRLPDLGHLVGSTRELINVYVAVDHGFAGWGASFPEPRSLTAWMPACRAMRPATERGPRSQSWKALSVVWPTACRAWCEVSPASSPYLTRTTCTVSAAMLRNSCLDASSSAIQATLAPAIPPPSTLAVPLTSRPEPPLPLPAPASRRPRLTPTSPTLSTEGWG